MSENSELLELSDISDISSTTSNNSNNSNTIGIYNINNIEPFEVKHILKQFNPYIYDTLFTDIIPKLQKINIRSFVTPLPLSDDGHYMVNYPFDYVTDKYMRNFFDIHFIIFVIYLDVNAETITEKYINCHHSLNIELSKKTFTLFKHIFKDKLEWDGSEEKSIIINY